MKSERPKDFLNYGLPSSRGKKKPARTNAPASSRMRPSVRIPYCRLAFWLFFSTITVMPGVRELAAEAGVSTATVSRALRNDPLVRKETRDLVLKVADKLGYNANPYVGKLMSTLRLGNASTFKGNLAILWVDGFEAGSMDVRLRDIRRGAIYRSEELGYCLDEFHLIEHRPAALNHILKSRGIRGVLIGAPSFSHAKSYLKIDLKDFACVALGWGLVHPPLPTIRFDYYQAIRLALHHGHHAFGKGIAGIWDRKTDRRAHHIGRASFLVHHPAGAATAQKLFWSAGEIARNEVSPLLRKFGIHSLMVGSGVVLPSWLRDAIPPENFIWLKNPKPAPCFGWIDTQNILLGRWGVDLLSANLHLNRHGVPEHQQIVMVPPRWMAGRR